MLSKGSQNGSHKAVKILLQKCYTDDLSKHIECLYTTKYESLVHKPLSPHKNKRKDSKTFVNKKNLTLRC